jgi:hypothetical protein
MCYCCEYSSSGQMFPGVGRRESRALRDGLGGRDGRFLAAAFKRR